MTNPLYLHGLLRCCDAPMWSVTRRGNRRYRCDVCCWSIDALSAEVEVWELVCRRVPDFGDGHTPYEQRGGRLTNVVRHVDLVWTRRTYTFRLSLRW
jgi:hypothetical protein